MTQEVPYNRTFCVYGADTLGQTSPQRVNLAFYEKFDFGTNGKKVGHMTTKMRPIIWPAAGLLFLSLALDTAPWRPAHAEPLSGSGPKPFTLKPWLNTGLCLQPVDEQFAGIGDPVDAFPCPITSASLPAAEWIAVSGQLQWVQTPLCLDAGPSVFNGSTLFLNTCNTDASLAPGQQWATTPVISSQPAPPLLWQTFLGTSNHWCLTAEGLGQVAQAAAVDMRLCTTLHPQWWIGGN